MRAAPSGYIDLSGRAPTGINVGVSACRGRIPLAERSSQFTESQRAGLGRRPFGGAGTGVAVDHCAGRPPGDGHQAAFGTAGAQPSGSGSVAHEMQMKAFYASRFGAGLEYGIQPVITEALAASAYPRRARFG